MFLRLGDSCRRKAFLDGFVFGHAEILAQAR
jgi:hypothetical protein